MSIRSAYSEEKAFGMKGHLKEGLYSEERRPGEFAFFLDQVEQGGGPVLELASGAARILMVLAGAGFEVYGLEASWPMLRLAKRAIALRPASEQRRISLVQGDMCNFHFIRLFPLIIIPYNSFWYNFYHSEEFDSVPRIRSAERCLKCIVECLTPGGRFVVDYPDPPLDKWWEAIAEKLGFSFTIVEPYYPCAKVLIADKIS